MGKEKDLLLSTIESYTISEKLFGQHAKIVIAVSGGTDSMALTEVLLSLREKYSLELLIAHVNYGLRGAESDGDEAFVRQYAENTGLPVYVKKSDLRNNPLPGGGSVQEQARHIRYEYFSEVCTTAGFDLIATGHTASDNAETLLLNLIRGSGPEGLKGIPPKRGNIIRPLLKVSRVDIESFVKTERIPFREDSSNESGAYARNILRNEVIPLIETKIRKNVRNSLNRTSEIIRAVDRYVEEQAHSHREQVVETIHEKEFFIKKNDLRSLHPVIADYIIRDVIDRLCGEIVSYDLTQRIRTLLDASSGSTVPLPSGYQADSESAGIRFYKNYETEPFRVELTPGTGYQGKSFTFKSTSISPGDVSFSDNKNTEYVDADLIGSPMVLRYWQEGDRIQPLGMSSFKKVSDVFIDAKIPRAYKNRIPILETPDGIVWICGTQLDDRFKVTKNSQNVLKLEYIPYATR